MTKKLFIVSDIHGHYTQMMKALADAGFDANNAEHFFVSIGDLFDRGRENRMVYDFVRSLERKILIKGNHEDMLCSTLERGIITVTERWNGTDITVAQLLGEGFVSEDGCFNRMAYAAKIDEITDFIDSMEDYYETGDYVLTHGWLPIVFDERRPYVNPDWRSASAAEWEDARFLEWQQLYDAGATLEGKTIVCGHRPARMGTMFDSSRELDCSEPFYGVGMIAIDAGTVRSGRVNVLVIEE